MEGADRDPGQKPMETEADRFATDTLIPPEAFSAFVAEKRFHAEDICRFADEVGIAPGVVVGRLQHDGCLKHSWRNELRERLEGW